MALALSLVFATLGALALVSNRVAADEGFVQVLYMNTRNAMLESVAAGSCLRGSENVGKELRELKSCVW
jgi:hypothetical protein